MIGYAKPGAALFIIVTALGFVGTFVHFTKKAATAEARIEAAEKSAAAANAGLEALAAEVVRRDEFNAEVRARRQAVSGSLDKVTDENPVARDYLGERIPDGVRDAIRQR